MPKSKLKENSGAATLKFSSTAYRAKVFDRIETNSAYSKHENKLPDINQEGLESEGGSSDRSAMFERYSCEVVRTMKPSIYLCFTGNTTCIYISHGWVKLSTAPPLGQDLIHPIRLNPSDRGI